jgi:hypothetical protein
MELSLHERQLIRSVRDAVEAEVSALRDSLQDADDFRNELTSTNRYLRVENKLLIETLTEHGISIPLPFNPYMDPALDRVFY